MPSVIQPVEKIKRITFNCDMKIAEQIVSFIHLNEFKGCKVTLAGHWPESISKRLTITINNKELEMLLKLKYQPYMVFNGYI